MINATSPATFPDLYFAGKKQTPKNAFKAGLAGLLLGSAGGVAALSKPPSNAVDNIINTSPADSLELAHAPRYVLNKHRNINWQALIEADETPVPLPEVEAPARRHLLATPMANAAALKLLQQPPFAPTDINIFSTNLFPQAKPMEPQPVTPINETAIQTTLKELFSKRFKGDAAQISAGMAVYNDPVLRAKVSHPKLRAAIAGLKGTASEGAIAVYKSDVFAAAKFQSYTGNPIAASVKPHNSEQMEVWVNPGLEGEDFRLLIQTMAHEPLHQDLQVNDTEEFIAHATTGLEYLKLLALYPDLGRSGTNLARYSNGAATDRLNTRTKDGKLSLFTPQNNTIPGSFPPFATIAAVYDVPNISSVIPSPGNPYLQSILKQVTGKDVPNPNFDANTLELLDQNQIYLSPSELITFAKALKLEIDPEGTLLAPAPAPQGLSADEALIAEAPEAAPDSFFEEADMQAPAPAESPTSKTYSRRLLNAFKRA